MSDASKRVVVTFQEKSKLITINFDDMNNTLERIRLKFSIIRNSDILAKCEEVDKFVDIDIDDDDDFYVLKSCKELLVRTAATPSDFITENNTESTDSTDSDTSLICLQEVKAPLTSTLVRIQSSSTIHTNL